jgi:uncharacterized repeat protein (TIGR02543 family)
MHYDFDGWVDEDGNSVYLGKKFNYNRDITLYAAWTKREHDEELDVIYKDGTIKVNYFLNGGQMDLRKMRHATTKYVEKM